VVTSDWFGGTALGLILFHQRITYLEASLQFRAQKIEKGLSLLAVLARDFTRVFFTDE
jgi:hypothetical protein